ncbi:MBL fold metallo-hydrolase [Mangrovivirga sp. M17]|uniref:MBL fold metallo-hydrolase n=1 Tax=Mangrovivirga halotolerans TaxID=2993936 RepID=A0ABT3RSX6_9BACT|nr:MBL fold metallo-hydrolase [Mangrovivirga halotolerans]MCX2744902.1 MBL fold metallo-hydrolase [Mangrovivirga halotolerans]
MIEIKFCGAAKTVTGSAHLITIDNETKVLLECGLYQGSDPTFKEFNEEWQFDPESIDLVILSHAHIDHSGRIPKLYKDGYKGNVICTHATRDLCTIMLLDTAHINQREVERKRKRGENVEPLYTSEDVYECLNDFISYPYNKWIDIHPKIKLLFRDAGHILGSASVTLKINTSSGEKVLGFSGDIGRPDRPILKDPQSMPELDYLIMESTYGGELHKELPEDEERFYDIIHQTCVENKGKLIIPAFSVGRTQELVYLLDKLENASRLPNIPVYVDSPLAINATDIFRLNPQCYDKELVEYMQTDPNPFGFNNLHYTRQVDDSKAINDLQGPAIIISASGMVTAGRILHHIYNHCENPRNTILMVGFCAPHTLGEKIRSKPDTIKIFGRELKLRARVEIMDSFSAHADENEMVTFLSNQDKSRLKNLFLIHGEENRQQAMKKRLEEEGYSNVVIPEFTESVRLI